MSSSSRFHPSFSHHNSAFEDNDDFDSDKTLGCWMDDFRVDGSKIGFKAKEKGHSFRGV